MCKSVSNWLLVGVFLLLNLPCFAQSMSDGTGQFSLKITVRVFNYARISPETWKAAQTVATRIFEHTGIETAWVDCSLSPEGRYMLPECVLPTHPTDIILRLVPTCAATRAHFGDASLGIAAPAEGSTPASASIFYDRVEELAKGGAASGAVILGHATAHEIGHLLLGSNSHSPLGLMRARWSRTDLQHANDGELFFLPREVETIREELQQRTKQGVLLFRKDSADLGAGR